MAMMEAWGAARNIVLNDNVVTKGRYYQLDAAPLEELERLQVALEAARQEESASAQEQESLEAQGRAIDAEREPAQQRLQAAFGKTSTIELRIGVLGALRVAAARSALRSRLPACATGQRNARLRKPKQARPRAG